LSRLRAPLLAGILLVFAGCDKNEDLLSPESGTLSEPGAEATPSEPEIGATPLTPLTSDTVLTPGMVTSATAPGVPFGDFHLPKSLFSSSAYSGSLQAVYPSSVYDVLNAARNNGERVFIGIVGNKRYYTNSDGTFNLTKWKYRVSLFKGKNLAQYVTSKTVLGHYMVDEPFCRGCWGGKQITYSQIEAMAKYSKALWPSMPTGVRSPPSKLGTNTYSTLDFAWAQWEGPLHNPSFGMTPQQFRDRETAAAQRLRLGLVFGLNYLDAGDGSSHINGTYYKDPNLSDNKYCKSGGSCYRYAMSAREVRNVGSVLAAASYGCGMVSWKYNTTFINRSGMKDALRSVAYAAKNRSRTSCVR
jgi:hypothetical protein